MKSKNQPQNGNKTYDVPSKSNNSVYKKVIHSYFQDGTTLKGLAQISAASSIQAIWKGFFHRTKLNVGIPNELETHSVDGPSEYQETLTKSTQTAQENDASNKLDIPDKIQRKHSAACQIQKKWKLFIDKKERNGAMKSRATKVV